MLKQVLLCICVYSWSETVKVVCFHQFMKMIFLNVLLCFSLYRMQEKHVKEKQCEHQRHIIELQEKLKKNQNSVRTTYIYLYMHSHSKILHVYCWSWVKGKKILIGITVCLIGVWSDIDEKIKICDIQISNSIEMYPACISIKQFLFWHELWNHFNNMHVHIHLCTFNYQ